MSGQWPWHIIFMGLYIALTAGGQLAPSSRNPRTLYVAISLDPGFGEIIYARKNITQSYLELCAPQSSKCYVAALVTGSVTDCQQKPYFDKNPMSTHDLWRQIRFINKKCLVPLKHDQCPGKGSPGLYVIFGLPVQKWDSASCLDTMGHIWEVREIRQCHWSTKQAYYNFKDFKEFIEPKKPSAIKPYQNMLARCTRKQDVGSFPKKTRCWHLAQRTKMLARCSPVK